MRTLLEFMGGHWKARTPALVVPSIELLELPRTRYHKLIDASPNPIVVSWFPSGYQRQYGETAWAHRNAWDLAKASNLDHHLDMLPGCMALDPLHTQFMVFPATSIKLPHRIQTIQELGRPTEFSVHCLQLVLRPEDEARLAIATNSQWGELQQKPYTSLMLLELRRLFHEQWQLADANEIRGLNWLNRVEKVLPTYVNNGDEKPDRWKSKSMREFAAKITKPDDFDKVKSDGSKISGSGYPSQLLVSMFRASDKLWSNLDRANWDLKNEEIKQSLDFLRSQEDLMRACTILRPLPSIHGGPR